MKALILTQAPVSNAERELLRDTKIFKLALNHHGEEYEPDCRIISDYYLAKICAKFTQKVVSVRERFRYQTKRVEYFDTEFKGATIVAAIEYLMSKNYKQILIVGDNTVHGDEFKNLVKREVDKIKKGAKIYQYASGNFNLPVMSIKEFCEYNKQKFN